MKYKYTKGELDSDTAVELELGLRNVANELDRLNLNLEKMIEVQQRKRWPHSAMESH